MEQGGYNEHPGSVICPALTAHGMISNHFGLGLGVGYSTFRWKEDRLLYDRSNIVYREDGSNKLNYLEIPLFARFVTGKGKSVSFFANVGVQASFFMSNYCDYTIRNTRTQAIAFQTKEVDQEIIRRILISPFAGFGVSYKVSPYLDVNFGPDIRYTASNIYDFYAATDFSKEHRTIIGGKIGLNIKIPKYKARQK